MRLHKYTKVSAVQTDIYHLLQLYEWAQPEAWILSHKPSAECCLRSDPTPHHIQTYDLAISSEMRHRAQVFCLAEPLSSLASSWNIIELSKQGILRSVPANVREEGCPRCLLCKASLALVTPGQDVLESQLLKPLRRTDITSC